MATGAAVVVLLDGDEARLVAEPRGRDVGHDRPDTPLCARAAATASRSPAARSPRVTAADRGRGRRALPAGARDDARIRQGPQAVRRARRVVPGGLPPLRADAAADRERSLDRLLRRVGRRRRPERLAEAAALAGAAAATGGREVTASAIQAHGGIGFTWEADVHWLYKRAQLDTALLGGAGRHHAALARRGGGAQAERAGRADRGADGWTDPIRLPLHRQGWKSTRRRGHPFASSRSQGDELLRQADRDIRRGADGGVRASRGG